MKDKSYFKSLGLTTVNSYNKEKQRVHALNFYYNYFKRLATNLFIWDGLPPEIPTNVLENFLFDNGHVILTETPEIGLHILKGSFNGLLNIYGLSTSYNPLTFDGFGVIKNKNIPIVWDKETVIDGQKGVIIGQNNLFQSFVKDLGFLIDKLVDIEMAIDTNRRQQNRPWIFLVDEEDLHSFKQIQFKIENMEEFITLKAKSNSGTLETTQLTDKIKQLNVSAPFILDKLADEKQRLINQVLTLMGINNNAVDKAERLTTSEANSNNGLLQANIEVMLQTRLKACDLINHVFGLNVTVGYNPNIQKANFIISDFTEDDLLDYNTLDEKGVDNNG